MIVLCLTGMLTFGSYMGYDSVGAIAPLLETERGIDEVQLGALYSAYSFPNFVMVFVGGMLIDRFGTNKCAVLFSSLVVLGSIVVALPSGNHPSTFWIMVVGRVIFGLGAESLVVCQSAILTRWFSGRELALAFGIQLTIARGGTLVSLASLGAIAKATSPTATFWLTAGVCLLCFALCVVLVSLDLLAAPILGLPKPDPQGRFRPSTALRFPSTFWLVALICVSFYSAVFSTVAFGVTILTEKYGYEVWWAGLAVSFITVASAVCAPLFGLFVDKVGYRTVLMMAGTGAIIPAYVLWAFTPIIPEISIVIIGMCFSIVPSALWPSVPLCVEETSVGTAFGLLTAMQNVGLFTSPLVVGGLRDGTGEWLPAMIWFIVLTSLGFVCSVALFVIDRRRGGMMLLSAKVLANRAKRMGHGTSGGGVGGRNGAAAAAVAGGMASDSSGSLIVEEVAEEEVGLIGD